MNHFISLILPVLIPFPIFIVLICNCFKKKVLIEAIVIGLLAIIIYAFEGELLEIALASGIFTFLVSYIILELIDHFVFKTKVPM